MAEETSTPASAVAEITHGPSKSEEFFEKNQKWLLALAVVITLGVIGYVVIVGLKDQAEKDAGAALINAQGDVDKLRSVIADHADTAASATAYLSLADALAATEDKRPEAIESLKSYLANFADHPGRASAHVRLGALHFEQGQVDEAIKSYKAVAEEKSDAYTISAFIALGDIAYGKGDKKAAVDYYTEAQKTAEANTEIPSAISRIAKERAKLVQLDAPIVVPAPVDLTKPEEEPAKDAEVVEPSKKAATKEKVEKVQSPAKEAAQVVEPSKKEATQEKVKEVKSADKKAPKTEAPQSPADKK